MEGFSRLHSGAVNIMDIIMFEAQRQGRLSFYMVFTPFFNIFVCNCFTELTCAAVR